MYYNINKDAGMEYEWDDNKSLMNLRKHNLSLAQGVAVFDDESRLDLPDCRKDYGKERRNCIGRYLDGFLSVCYTIRNGKRRLISVRPASKKEKVMYYEHNKNDA